MHFNVDRIAVLAGLGGGRSSGLMKEGAPAPAAAPAPVKATAPPKPPAPTPTAKASPAPSAAPSMGAKKMEEEYDENYMADEGYMADEEYMSDEGYHSMGGGMDMSDVVYEVDETALMEALVDMREKRINESRVRAAVRTELNDILNGMESGSRWMYGDRKPGASGSGKVHRGFLGPGFR